MAEIGNNRRHIGILRDTALFCRLSDDELEAVARLTNTRYLTTNQTLFWQGDPSAHFFCLQRGSIKLTRRDAKGRHKTFALIGPGKFFAEHTMFSGNGYPATAIALEETELLAIQSIAFVRFLQKRPELSWRMLKNLSGTIDRLVDQIEYLTTHQAEERIAAFLIERFNSDQPDAMLVGVPTRRSDLADLLSLSHETVSRVISKFRRLGWIATRGNDITVREQMELRNLLVKSDSAEQPRRRA